MNKTKNDLILTNKLRWEEKEELCHRWKESGMNKTNFCKKYGLSLSTFCEWCYCLWPRSNTKHTPKLTPVKIITDETRADGQIMLELSLPNQTQIRIHLPMSNAVSLIRELCDATAIIR